MAIAGSCSDHPPLPLSKTRRRAPAPDLRFPAAAPPLRRPRKSSLVLAVLLAVVVAAAVIPQPALAASGGAMGGRSSSSSRSSSSRSSSSPRSTFFHSSTSYSSSSSSSSSLKRETHASHAGDTQFWVVVICVVLLVHAVWHYTQPTTTVVKLQVALLGSAKSFQKELNEIAETVDASDQRWYKLMLTETICSLRRHRDSCIASSLSVDVKDKVDSWEEHFDKISIEERSKFDEETLYSLEGIKRKKQYSKRKKQYSKKPDGFRNEYIVLTILVAADGALKFPEVISTSDLAAVVEKLNFIPAKKIQGIHVLWTPQEENDILSEEKLLEDYPSLKWDD